MSSGGSGSDGEGGGGGGGGEVEEGGGGGGGCPVTAAWLEAVLAEHHGVSESDVAVEQLSARPGCDAADSVLSDILAVSVRYRLDQQPRHLHLIVKLLPQDPFSRYFVTEAQFDLREIKFYTKVVPDLHSLDASVALPIPQCYHARYTADVESVLVLENLKERGYEGVDFSKGLTLAQAESALDAVARLHALGLAYKIREKVELDEHYPFLFQTARASDSYQQLVERGLPQLAAFLRAQPNTEHLLRSLNLIRPHTKHIIAALLAPQEPIALITHTDFWCNNLLFTPQDQCAVLDWQMVTYSRPTNDVALLLVSSLPTELRRTHTDQLLDHYWTAFTSTARRLRVDVDAQLGYDRRRLGADFRRSQLLALLLCIGSVDVALGDPLTEQRLIDVLHDLHDDGILSLDVLDLPNS